MADQLGFLPESSVEFLDEHLGAGGQGVVTSGRWTQPDGTQVSVALKKLADGATERETAQFQKEFAIHRTASQRCPSACTLYGCVHRDSALCLVMERYERSLHELLDSMRDPADDSKRAKMPAEQAAIVAHQIAVGLSQLHGEGIVCNDLKPGNCLMDAEGNIAISDFGLAVVVESSIARATTRTGAAIGTVSYMAPEQHDPDTFGKASTKTDVWALGCILLELLTGEPPWAGRKAPNITFL